MASQILWILVFALAVTRVWCNPAFFRDPDARPLAAISEISSRVVAHAQRDPEARLPIPTPQDLEAIKKVAQILITLGQQVIPAIIGETSSASSTNCEAPSVEDVPNDAVSTST